MEAKIKLSTNFFLKLFGHPRGYPGKNPGISQPELCLKSPENTFRKFSGKSSKWGLSTWGLKMLVHNCPRFSPPLKSALSL